MGSQRLNSHSGKPNLLKRFNDEILLNLIKERGPISRVELSQLSKISAPTVTRVCRWLEKEGLIGVSGRNTPTSKGGRYAELWEFNNADAGFVLGISIDFYNIEIVIVDSHCNILWKEVKEIRVEEYKKDLGNKIIKNIRESSEQSNISLERIIGIGIGISGVVDTQNGIVINSVLCEKNFPLKSIIEHEFGINTAVENDARSMTFCEMRIGAGEGKRNIFGIHLKKRPDFGIGYGIIVNGQIYHGARGGAGEPFHFDVPYTEILNMLDKEPQEEHFFPQTSAVQYPEIVSKTQKMLESGMSSIMLEKYPITSITEEDVIDAAKKGDKLALRVLEEVGVAMGIGIMNIAALLNPEMIIIDGKLQDAGELLLEPIRKIMKRLSIQCGMEDVMMRGTEVVFGKIKEHVVSLGAACQMLEKIYKLPHLEFSYLSSTMGKRQSLKIEEKPVQI